MTGPPATGQDAATDSDETRTLRRKMVTALVNDGTLTDDRWRHAFLAVSRHVLVPNYYQSSGHVDGRADPQRWLRLVYSDTTLVTQRRPDAVTSSGTMPSLVALMLQALEIDDDHRVLQVATGTGYTAALLCERLGSNQVTSIDVDPDLTIAARDRLRRCGYTPTVITADGADGYPEHAPYDRIIVAQWAPGRPDGRTMLAVAHYRPAQQRLLRQRLPVLPRPEHARPRARLSRRRPSQPHHQRARRVTRPHHPRGPAHPIRTTPALGRH